MKGRYFGLHEDGLRNGSFFRLGKYGVAQYVNGDYMGSQPADWIGAGPTVAGLPETYYGQPLKEFDAKVAEKLIPKVCL